MRQVADFRRQHGDLLLRGRFIDVDGILVEGEGIVGEGFESAGRVGVVLWNPGNEPQTAKVSVAGCEFSAVDAPGASGAVDRSAPIQPESICLQIWTKRQGLPLRKTEDEP